MEINSKLLFDPQTRVAPLGVIAMEGAAELGEKVNRYLTDWSSQSGFNDETFLIETSCPRFQSGDSKALIKQTVRGSSAFTVPKR